MIEPGDILQGRYLVVRELAKGGFGQTFEIDDRNQRKVLKVLMLGEYDSYEYQQKIIELFQQEAKVLSQLNYPGIPKVEPDGYFTVKIKGYSEEFHCLVMEYIDGLNLEQWSKKNSAISQAEAINWLKQLVEILHQVHQHKFFHRDIKPSNIMLSENGQLVLIDFGGVRQINASYLVQIGLEKRGTQIISPGYTPREQYEGKALLQSDFFALGRTFVYLLTGKHPLDFEEDDQTGQLLWRKNATDISPHFADLIDDLMALLSVWRPQSTTIILQRLAAVEFAINNGLSVIKPDNNGSRNIAIPRDSQPSRRWLKFGLAGALLLGLGGLGRIAAPQVAVVCNDLGVENHLAKRLVIAEAFYRSAIALKSDNGNFHYNYGSLAESRGNLKLAQQEYNRAIALENDQAHNNQGRLYILEGKYSEAVPLLKKGLPLAEDNLTKYQFNKNLGWGYFKQNNYQEANFYLQQAIKLDNQRPDAHCLLAQVSEAQGNKQSLNNKWKACLKYIPDSKPELKEWQKIANQRLQVAIK
ncbi:MAG: protein kinase [Crinalium sp.]